MSFAAVITRDDRVLVSFEGRQVVTLAGGEARKLIARLERAGNEETTQLVLAKATGNFKRGNER